jgi:hypothetical protein
LISNRAIRVRISDACCKRPATGSAQRVEKSRGTLKTTGAVHLDLTRAAALGIGKARDRVALTMKG